jgi:hypothetical protein
MSGSVALEDRPSPVIWSAIAHCNGQALMRNLTRGWHHGSSTSKALLSYLLSFVNLNSIFCLVTHFLFLPKGNPAGLDTADAQTH